MSIAEPGPVPSLTFAGGLLDRADHVRGDPSALATAFADPAARVLVLENLLPLTDGELIAREPVAPGASLEDHVLMGLGAQGPLFARIAEQPPAGGAFNPGMWDAIGALNGAEQGLFAMARSLVDWHIRHRHCAVCGAPTMLAKGGWSRRCAGCKAEHFPRVDPVTIMLPEYRGRVLIGRQPRFPPRRFSGLAGYIEPGETIEQAVARELFEEAGIRVRNIRYVMSQPWPFPSTLMIACTAEAEDDALTVDTNELEEAIWVSADDVRAAIADDDSAPFLMPSHHAIAHHLLMHWLNRQV